METGDIYGPKPIKLDTFDSIESITGHITAAERKRFDLGEKVVLTLDDEWSVVINNTSYYVIRAAYGKDPDEWVGRPLTVYKGTTYYRGEEKPGVCVRIPPQDDDGAQDGGHDDGDDDLDGGKTMAPAADKLDAVNVELRASGADDPDDDIPF